MVLSRANSDSPKVPHHSSAGCQQFAHTHSLVHIGNAAVEARRHQKRDGQNRERRQRRMDERQILVGEFEMINWLNNLLEQDELLLERNVDRVNAEKRLTGGQLGDYLLRARGENSAALSLKGTKGILHIKIEKRDNKWIIGKQTFEQAIYRAGNFCRGRALFRFDIFGHPPLQKASSANSRLWSSYSAQFSHSSHTDLMLFTHTGITSSFIHHFSHRNYRRKS